MQKDDKSERKRIQSERKEARKKKDWMICVYKSVRVKKGYNIRERYSGKNVIEKEKGKYYL